MLIEKLIGNIEDYDTDGLIIDKIYMDHYDLTKPHQKLTSESGDVYAVSLDDGQSLARGSVLYKDDEKIVCIELVKEKVLVIKPKDNIQWARSAFNIGNMHQAAYIYEDSILVPYDAILEGVIRKLGTEYSIEDRKLEGIRANVTQGDHHHGHHHHHHHE